MMKIEVDKDLVRTLLEDINRNLALLSLNGSPQKQKEIIDFLLEGEGSPVKTLAKILNVDV